MKMNISSFSRFFSHFLLVSLFFPMALATQFWRNSDRFGTIGNLYVTSLGHDSSALFSLKTIMAKTNFTNKKYVFMKIDFIRWGGNSKRSIFAVYTFFQFILEVFFWKWTYFFENQSKPNFIMAAVEFVWRSNLVTSSKTKRHQMTTNQNRRLTATIMKKALESRAI